jgi:hypothetical protein
MYASVTACIATHEAVIIICRKEGLGEQVFWMETRRSESSRQLTSWILLWPSTHILKPSKQEERNAHSPSCDADLPGGALPYTSLNDISNVDLLYVLWLDACLFDSVLYSYDTELRSREGSESSVDWSDGCTGSGEDVDCLRLGLSAVMVATV